MKSIVRQVWDRICSSCLTTADPHVVELFTRKTSFYCEGDEADYGAIKTILTRIAMPPEVFAIAFNILCELERRSLAKDYFSGSGDLLMVSALSLAAISVFDDAPWSSHWSRQVCRGTWTARQIDGTTLLLLAALDWRLLDVSAPLRVAEAMTRLATPG